MLPWITRIKNVMSSTLADELCAKVVLEQCLDTVLVSISLVMAGTGNIKVLRIARQLHKRCSTDVWYGHHMAVHMAIGFLFLGGGRYTLKTDNLSIACLLCAVYPKWPTSSKDNRFHLQALRHLYVLACEPRLFITKDIETKKMCYVPIEVTMKETLSYPESIIKYLAPCFIPQLKDIKQIRIIGPRYWPITFKVCDQKFTLEQLNNIHVKKRSGYLSYSEDPKGNKNLLGRTFTSQSDKLDLIKSFNSNPNIVLFEEIFCVALKTDCEKKKYEYYSNVLYECVTKDKMDILKDYLAIENIISNAEQTMFHIHDIQQMKFLFTYYSSIRHKLVSRGVINKDSLISNLYVMQANLRMEMAVNNQLGKRNETKAPTGFHIIESIVKSLSNCKT